MDKIQVIKKWAEVVNSRDENKLRAFLKSSYSPNFRGAATSVNGATSFYTYQDMVPIYQNWFAKKTVWTDITVVIADTGYEMRVTMRWPSGRSYRTRAVYQFVDGKIVTTTWNPA